MLCPRLSKIFKINKTGFSKILKAIRSAQKNRWKTSVEYIVQFAHETNFEAILSTFYKFSDGAVIQLPLMGIPSLAFFCQYNFFSIYDDMLTDFFPKIKKLFFRT